MKTVKPVPSLTKAEEEIMQLIWNRGRCLVSDLLDDLGEPRPPHSSVSTIVRILEKKGFVGHKAYGRTYEYFPLVTKDSYSKSRLDKIAGDFFDGSFSQMVSFLVEQDRLDADELEAFIATLKKETQS
ncbi:MAG: BlaI/MecI/CopY family transcriptional regulator [Saprospiraceae bacterium]|nr:BlaI/MecI/CopY family transcriptional regulator [Saprospiraceae bacterium]